MENTYDTAIINLGDYLIGQTKVLTFALQGKNAKEKSKINKFEKHYLKIKIIAPQNLMSANPSFLQGLLQDVVIKLGREEFYKKFTFECQGTYNIERDIGEAISRILRETEMT